MKSFLFITLIMTMACCSVFAQNEKAEDEALIKQVIQSAYVDGLCNNADEEAVQNGFHPGFELCYAGRGNAMWKLPIYNWIGIAKEGKATKHKYSFQDEFTTVKFLYVDVEGNIAVSKFEFYEGETLKYIDFLSLIRFEDGWKIVSKISHPVPGE